MRWTATLHEEPGSPPLVIGTSNGRRMPSDVIPEGEDSPLHAELLGTWASAAGLTGTGSISQVRDMVYVMSLVADARGLHLEVPAATRRKADREAERDAASLPDGAVW